MEAIEIKAEIDQNSEVHIKLPLPYKPGRVRVIVLTRMSAGRHPGGRYVSAKKRSLATTRGSKVPELCSTIRTICRSWFGPKLTWIGLSSP